MKHLLCPLAFFLLTASCAHAQDTPPSGISQDSAIHATLVQGHKYPTLVYSANGQILSNREIIARLQLYPEPADELQKYHNGRTGSVVWLGVFVGAAITAGVEKGQGNSGAQYSFGSIALAAVFAVFVSAAQAGMHFDRAIKVYNKRFVP